MFSKGVGGGGGAGPKGAMCMWKLRAQLAPGPSRPACLLARPPCSCIGIFGHRLPAPVPPEIMIFASTHFTSAFSVLPSPAHLATWSALTARAWLAYGCVGNPCRLSLIKAYFYLPTAPPHFLAFFSLCEWRIMYQTSRAQTHP